MTQKIDHLKVIHPMIVCARRKKNFYYGKFILYIEEHLDEIVTTLNTRWLVSITDTIADYDPDPERAAKALIVSTYVNTLKFCSFDYKNIDRRSIHRKEWPEQLWDGVEAVDRRCDDFFQNMVQRSFKLIGDDILIKRFYGSVLARSIRKPNGPVGEIFKHHIFIEDFKEMDFDLPNYHERRMNKRFKDD